MIWKHIWTYILGLVFLYLQLLVMPSFEIADAIPNILIPWVLYLVWTREANPAMIIAFLIGLMYDITQPISFGLHAFAFVVLCFTLNLFRKPFEAESKVARILTLVIANLIFYLMQWLILGVVYGFGGNLMVINLIAFAYNLAVSFIVFWTMILLSKVRLVLYSD